MTDDLVRPHLLSLHMIKGSFFHIILSILNLHGISVYFTPLKIAIPLV